jgi:flagellin-like protein
MDKRGISPVIATVLLISIVVVAAFIILIALLGFRTEVITKFGSPVETICANDVDLDATISGSDLTIRNRGDVGIWNVQVMDSSGSEISCDEVQIAIGRTKTISCSGADVVIPIIRGQDEDGNPKNYVCEDLEFSVF